MGRTVVLEVDTGTDDAVAIILAALHPNIDPLEITTVNGNVPLVNTTDHIPRVLDWTEGSQLPVFAGLSRPIAR